MTSKFKIKQIIGSVLSRAFVCRLARVAAAIGSRVIDWERLTPPPQVAGDETPQQLQGVSFAAGLNVIVLAVPEPMM